MNVTFMVFEKLLDIYDDVSSHRGFVGYSRGSRLWFIAISSGII